MQTLPEADRHLLPACIQRARADVEPATDDDIDRAALLLIGLPGRDLQGISAAAADTVYQIGFDDIPADLLNIGVRQAIKHCRFRPAPKEVRDFIADELEARHLRLARLMASA